MSNYLDYLQCIFGDSSVTVCASHLSIGGVAVIAAILCVGLFWPLLGRH